MSTDNSQWLWGFLYINPNDERLLVPWKLGMAVNFAHPGATRLLWVIWIIALTGCFTVPILLAPTFVVQRPLAILWAASALAVPFVLIRLNNCFHWRDYRHISWAAFGFIAIGIGFGLQGLINGPLVQFWGAERLSWKHHLFLGTVAAIAQTAGKVAAIHLLFRVASCHAPAGAARDGLLVGLGVTLTEIAFIFFALELSQGPLEFGLALWERASSSMFHLYSSGLLAWAIWQSRYGVMGLVVGVHGLTDFLAGAHEPLGISLLTLEIIISVCALCLWIFFLRVGFLILTDSSNSPTNEFL